MNTFKPFLILLAKGLIIFIVLEILLGIVAKKGGDYVASKVSIINSSK